MSREARPNLKEHRIRIAMLHVLRQMGVDTRSLELEFPDTVASRQRYDAIWLQAVIQLCVEHFYWQEMQRLQNKQLAENAASRAAHRRAQAVFWTMFVRAFASVAQTANAHIAIKPTTDTATLQALQNAMVSCIASLEQLQTDFVALQTTHTNKIQNSLAAVLGGEVDADEIQEVAADLLDLSETQRLTLPARQAKLDNLADRNLLGPMAHLQNPSFQLDKTIRLGTSENPGGLNLEILMMGLLLERLKLPISKAKLVLKQVRPEVLNAWQQNGEFQNKIDSMLNKLDILENALAHQKNTPSIALEHVLVKNNALLPSQRLKQRPKPSPSLSVNNAEDQKQEKDALDNDTIAEKKRIRSPLRDALRRMKNPWALS